MMRASLLILLADPILWSTLWYARCADEEYGSARTYILNPLRLSWSDAAVACREMGGELAIIRKFTTIPTLDLEGDWTFWIGLTKTEESKWVWTDSTDATWTNWRTGYLSNEIASDDPCSVAVTMLPYWWDPRNCSSAFPSLCELQEGRLRDGFTVSPLGLTTEDTTPVPSTTDPTPPGLFCTQLKSIDPNTTEPVPEEVKELQSMNVVLKARQVTLKRISVADYRPSANYVGSTAVIIAFSLVGSVVICDLVSLLRHLCKCHRKLRKHRNRHNRYEVGEREELKITAHMNAVTRHMQYISQNSIEKNLTQENGDCLPNDDVLSEHSFSRINGGFTTDDGKSLNGSVPRDKKTRSYDWSDEHDHTRDILEVEVDLTSEDAKNEGDDLNRSTNSSKFIYRTYESTNL